MNLVRYWWSSDGEEEICNRIETTVEEETECYHCLQKHKAGSRMSMLQSVEEKEAYFFVYRMCRQEYQKIGIN